MAMTLLIAVMCDMKPCRMKWLFLSLIFKVTQAAGTCEKYLKMLETYWSRTYMCLAYKTNHTSQMSIFQGCISTKDGQVLQYGINCQGLLARSSEEICHHHRHLYMYIVLRIHSRCVSIFQYYVHFQIYTLRVKKTICLKWLIFDISCKISAYSQ